VGQGKTTLALLFFSATIEKSYNCHYKRIYTMMAMKNSVYII